MKRTVQTGLMLLMVVKSVFACEFPVGFEPVSAFAGNERLYWWMVFATIGLIVPIVVLFIVRRYEGLWTLVSAVGALLMYIPALFIAFIVSPCTDAMAWWVIVGEFFAMCLLFTISFSNWISKRKSPSEIP